jgi:cell division transport system permease protein
MSTIEPFEAMAEPWDDLETAATRANAPRVATPIVPRGSIAVRSLTAVIAIMTFLAALTTGAVMMVLGAARDWQADVGREVTVQVRPAAGRDIEADVAKTLDIVRAAAGIADVRAFTKQESAALVEPWLGSGLALDQLPIPRMIVVKLQPGAKPDFTDLRKTLVSQVPSASLDDHRRWVDRMRTMAGTAVFGGIVVLGLVLAATVLSVTFATHGAMAANRPIIEVLHYVGATDGFVLSQFQRHFLILGLKGGAIGGGIAIALFGFLEAANAWLAGTPGGDETTALLGGFWLGIPGYVALLALIVLMAVATALASRRTVSRTLESMD